MFALTDSLQHGLWSVIGWGRFQLFQRHRTLTIQTSLIVACFLLTLISSMLMKRSPLFGFAAAGGVAGLAALLFVYRNMEIACMLIAPVTTLLNLGVGTGTGTPLMLSQLLLLLILISWLLRLVVFERSFKSVRALLPNKPILIFAVCVVISFVWGNLYVETPVRSFMESKLLPRIMTGMVFIISPVTSLMIANHVRSLRAFKFIVWWFIIVGGFIGVIWIVGIPMPFLFNNRGQIGVWTTVLVLGQIFYNRQLSPWKRIALFIIPAIWTRILFGLGIDWLSGWAPLLLGIVGSAFFYSRKLFAVFMIIAAIYALGNLDFFSKIFEEENAISGQTRVLAWERTIKVVRDHFLFGTGPAGYYFYLTVYIGGFFQLSHNNYVDVIAQTGVLGFATYIVIWLCIGWMVLKAYLIAPPTDFLRGLANSLLVCYGVSLVIMMLGDWVIPFPYTQTLAGISYTIWPWMLMGLAMGLYYYCKEQQTPQPPELEVQV